MLDEQTQLLILKGYISELPGDQQGKIREAKEALDSIISEYEEEGLIALSLIALEEIINSNA